MQTPKPTPSAQAGSRSPGHRLAWRRWGTCLLLASLSAGAAGSAPPSAAARGQKRMPAHTITYDRYSLKIDGKRLYVWSGSFHYWRLPSPDLWQDVLQKMKSGGYNAVDIYFDWEFHSPRKGVYDFSGIRNVDRLLDMATAAGIYVIARPGPYINAETDGGGLPAWLATEAGRPRSTAPDYTAAYREWMSHIDPILARHQLTNGTGTIILYQVENELYDRSADSHRYMKAIEDKARADGITVPFSGNHNAGFQNGIGAVDIPGYDSYPLGFDCRHPERWKGFYAYHDERKALTKSPLFFPEYQGGAFDTWGGAGYDRCRELTGPAFERVFYEANMASGSTMQNFYMTYGGTNWGWLASPGVYTSYDYGAAITAGRQLTPKYDQQKLIGYLIQSVAPLAKTDAFTPKPPGNKALQLDGRINPDSGTRFYFLRHKDVTSTSDEHTRLWLKIAPFATASHAGGETDDGQAVEVPQQPGTSLRIHGRDSKILLTHYRFGTQQLVYSTSDWLTSVSQAERDVAVIYGRAGEDGETVLRYATRPDVTVLDGAVSTHWDASTGTLRLNYRHDGLARVLIGQGAHSLLLLIGDNAEAARFWRLETARGPVLVRGSYLVRTASLTGDHAIELTGDTAHTGELEVLAPADIDSMRWNGQRIHARRTASGSLLGRVDGPQQVAMPVLAHWRHRPGAPEIAPGFDDSRWLRADRRSTTSPFWNGHLPILDSDVYGFHHGNVWYRGRFIAKGTEKGASIVANTGIHDGNNGVFSVWLNGHFLGTRSGGKAYVEFPAADVLSGKQNVIAVLVSNMGHNQEGHSRDSQLPRGLGDVHLDGSLADVAWKIQGARGGEQLPDPARGPLNNGGLFGERSGWSLPGYPDGQWQQVTLPHEVSKPGVDWYRTTFDLHVPADQDVPVALQIEDRSSRHYRALIFVNGWQLGRYINGTGPQHRFILPAGILHTHGSNTISIASWSTDRHGGLGKVSLIALGDYKSALRVETVSAPSYRH